MKQNTPPSQTVDPRVLEQVKTLWEKKTLPSVIGHYLRDHYCLKYKRLCKVFPFLNEKLIEQQLLDKKLNRLKEHLKINKKDYVSKRSLRKLVSKRFNLR